MFSGNCRRGIHALIGLAASAMAHPALAQDAQIDPVGEAAEELIVQQARKGPNLWLAEKAGHEMWIMGIQSPGPKGLKWDSSDVGKVIAEADIVVPFRWELDAGVGVFKGIGLLLRARKVTKNDDGARLKDLVPADLYARFSALRKQFGADNDEWEEFRPAFAGLQLTEQALEKNKLRQGDFLWSQAMKIAKKEKKPILETKIKENLDFKEILRKLDQVSPTDELACFSETITALEKDLPKVRRKAFAWAAGDVQTIRALSRENKAETACGDPVLAIPELRHLRDKGDGLVFKNLMEAAAKHKSVFVLADMTSVVRTDKGLLNRLKAEGFTIDGP